MKKISSIYHVFYISIIVILFILMIGGFYFFHRKAEKKYITMMGASREQGIEKKPSMRGMMMVALTPPPLSDQQAQQATTGISTVTTQKTFNITGGNFYFVPNKITVNKGDQVTFVMVNAGGVHDLIIDELGIKTPVIHTGETASVTFTASRAGSFVYYCDIPGHRTKGMWGNIIVQ